MGVKVRQVLSQFFEAVDRAVCQETMVTVVPAVLVLLYGFDIAGIHSLEARRALHRWVLAYHIHFACAGWVAAHEATFPELTER